VPVVFPEKQSGIAGDFDSYKPFVNGTLIGGDRFTFSRFERPFNANTMDVYFPYLDIIDTYVYQDETWIFAGIILKGTDEDGNLPGNYAAEIDIDINGKGDFLIITSNPTSTDWTTTNVRVYEDKDTTVGDKTPTVTDENGDGNGFESLVFDQGEGDDPETAWVRLAPDKPNTVELAIKRSLFKVEPTELRYLINMWAGTDILDPALFDINDHFSHEEAGAADKGLEFYYPIKAVAEVDNTCKMAIGFKPTGNEPGLCDLPTAPQEKGCVSDPVWVNRCKALGKVWNYKTCTCVTPIQVNPVDPVVQPAP